MARIDATRSRHRQTAWDRVPTIGGSHWGFIGLIIGIFVLLVVALILCICCIRRSKNKKRMKYAAQGQDLTTTHPEPTYGRKNTTNKPARRPMSGRQNGGYGNEDEEEDAYAAGPTSNAYNNNSSSNNNYQRAGVGAGALAGASHVPMQETGTGSQAGYNGGYGGYAHNPGAGYEAGYGSEYGAAHNGQYDSYEGDYGNGQQFAEAPTGMAYTHDQSSAYGHYQPQPGAMSATGYEGSVPSHSAPQPMPVQPGAYSYDQHSQYSQGQPGMAGSSSQNFHRLPVPPTSGSAAGAAPYGSRAHTPQAASFYAHGDAAGSGVRPQQGYEQQQQPPFGSQTFEGYSQHARGGLDDNEYDGYGTHASAGGMEEPPAYHSYDANAPGGSSSSGPSGGAPAGLPGTFQLPPEKSRGPDI